MSGESPATIPLSPPRSTTLTVSEANAAKLGMTIRPDVLQVAKKR